MDAEGQAHARRVSRRDMLFGAAGLAVGGAAGAVGAAGARTSPAATPVAARTVPFRGAHQAGIATPPQEHMAFAAFDATTSDRAALAALLREWTAAAEAMARGRQLGDGGEDETAAPPDTGETQGASPANLTVTVGFGPGLFDDRFGLAARRPVALQELPHFAGDLLADEWSGGDLCVQACADDPMVAYHAVHDLNRIAFGTLALRWLQLGFGKTSTTTRAEATPRNLMGFKDGTRSIKAEDADVMDRFVWVGADADQPWMRGGSYLVARRIRIVQETWDRDHLGDQENVIGRYKGTGAPLGGNAEFDTPDFAARGADGRPVIPSDAHIRRASPEENGGARILRRGYSFTDGTDPRTGQLLSGLFFIAFQNDPQSGFVRIQRRLAELDGLNEYIKHVGSAVFAVPGGLARGGYWGEGLLD